MSQPQTPDPPWNRLPERLFFAFLVIGPPVTLNQVEQFVRNWYLANELKSWGKVDPGVHLI